MLCFAELISAGQATLEAAEIEGARRDSRLLLAFAADLSIAELISREFEAPEASVAAVFEGYIRRRATGEPVSRIRGEREFYGRSFKVTPDVLDPRPDTECIVEKALELLPDTSVRVLDIGVGSGCILLSILTELKLAAGLGIDKSQAALDVAQDNAVRLGVADQVFFQQSDWLNAVAKSPMFDLVVSNPPYIPSSDIEKLDLDVRDNDPRLALDGGEDGLDAYRNLIPAAELRLKSGGVLLFEVGDGQADSVAEMMSQAAYTNVAVCKDLSGKNRGVYGCYGR